MTITLSQEQEKMIQAQIAAGRFHSVDEVLESALAAIQLHPDPGTDKQRSQRAGERIRQLRKGVTLGGTATIRELIDEGRE